MSENIIQQTGISWKILNQKHDDYNASRINKLNLLLKGGYDISNPINAKKFMPRLQSESNSAYKDRLSFASYENNFGAICNNYSSTLFSKPVAVLEATDSEDANTPGEMPSPDSPHMQWQRHFTLDNKSMADFIQGIQSESNATGVAYYGVDFKLDGSPYAYWIDAISVLDWQFDEEGNLVFIVLRNDDDIRTSIRQSRDTLTTTFIVWTKSENVVKLDKYSITYPKKQPPTDEDIVNKIQNDEYSEAERKDASFSSSFKSIPIIVCKTPEKLSVGQLIGQLSGSLFARYSTYLFCLNRGINPLLVYKQGAELPANGDLSVMTDNDDRGEDTVKSAQVRGKAVIGPNDELQWVEVKGNAYSNVQEQLIADKNELYRLCSSLTSIISNAGVSTAQTKAAGVAKEIDNRDKEHMLEAYAKLVKEWLIKGFSIVYEARGEDVVWQCKGLDNYRVVDDEILMQKIAAIPIYQQNMPSKTSLEFYLNDLAYQIHPFANVGTMNKIQDEIHKSIEKKDLEEVHASISPEGIVAAQGAKDLNAAKPTSLS